MRSTFEMSNDGRRPQRVDYFYPVSTSKASALRDFVVVDNMHCRYCNCALTTHLVKTSQWLSQRIVRMETPHPLCLYVLLSVEVAPSLDDTSMIVKAWSLSTLTARLCATTAA